MRIGFDAFPMQVKPSGIGKYAINVIEEIIEDIPAEFFAYSNNQIGLSDKLNSRIFKREFSDGFEGKLPGKVWLKFFSGSYIKDDNLDFYISTTGFFPRLPQKVKKIAIVHDFNAKLVPETMGKLHYLTHLFFFKRDILSADFIISNSIGTAKKLFFYYKKETDEIINPPVSTAYRSRSAEEMVEIREKYDIKGDYILFVGNLEPRKNLAFVLKNFTDLVEEKKINNIKLVIVGLKGWNDGEIQNLLEKYKDNVTTLGYVNESDLPAIYSAAKLFVFPSIYEGFGIPVREALLSGTPVLTTDIPELREAGEIAANENMIAFIKPNDDKNFKRTIIKYIQENIILEASTFPIICMPKLKNFLRS